MTDDEIRTHVWPTEWLVSCLPEDDPDRDLWGVHVSMRSPGRYAVTWLRSCYDAEGHGEYEPIPSERGKEFLARFRHGLDDALDLAQRLAPILTVNGLTAADVLARKAASDDR